MAVAKHASKHIRLDFYSKHDSITRHPRRLLGTAQEILLHLWHSSGSYHVWKTNRVELIRDHPGYPRPEGGSQSASFSTSGVYSPIFQNSCTKACSPKRPHLCNCVSFRKAFYIINEPTGSQVILYSSVRCIILPAVPPLELLSCWRQRSRKLYPEPPLQKHPLCTFNLVRIFILVFFSQRSPVSGKYLVLSGPLC